jgi:hypothetical protein
VSDPFAPLRELTLEELAAGVGLWRRILHSGRLAVESDSDRRFMAAIESAANELRDVGFDPEEVLRAAPEKWRGGPTPTGAT